MKPRFSSAVIAAALVIAVFSPAASAPTFETVDTVVVTGSGTSLAADATADTVIVNNYKYPQDGGGGIFIRSASSACSGLDYGADGGVVIQGASSCYYRQFAGAVHLKWYGVRWEDDVASILPHAFAAAKYFQLGSGNPNQVGTVDTDGLKVISSDWILVPNNTRLTCDAPFTAQMDNPVAATGYADVGGPSCCRMASQFISTAMLRPSTRTRWRSITASY